MISSSISAFFIGVSTAFFTIFAIHILCFRPNRTRFQTVLGYTMCVWAILNLKDLILTFPEMYTPSILNWVMIIDGWSAISYTVLLLETVMPQWFTWKRILYFSIPFCIFTAAYALVSCEAVIYAYAVFLWIYAWTIVIFGYSKVRKHIKYVHENYSNIENIDVSWLRPVFAFVITTQILWLITSLYGEFWLDILYYISCLASWLMVLRYSWNFQPIQTNASTQSNPIPKQFPFADKLEKVMKEKKLYLRPDLTLDDLAQEIGTNRLYASNYLNQAKGITFYDYINQLRITEVSIPLMKEHSEYTLEHIAIQSGFKSISTFRRAFVKLTGENPSNYNKT